MNIKDNNTFIFYENLNNHSIVFCDDNKFFNLGFEEYFKYLSESEKKFIEKLFDYATNFNSGYVDSIVWYSYLATSNIEIAPMKEQYISINTDHIKNIDFSIQKSGRNINSFLSKNSFKDNQICKIQKKSLFEFNSESFKLLSINMKSNDFNILQKKTIYYDTNKDLEFLISFFHCIFSTYKRFYLKKCKRCKHYYVTNKSDNKYCNRKYIRNNISLSCSEITTLLKKKYKYIKLKNTYKAFLNDFTEEDKIKNKDYIDEYKKIYEELVEKYIETEDITQLEDFILNYTKTHQIK